LELSKVERAFIDGEEEGFAALYTRFAGSFNAFAIISITKPSKIRLQRPDTAQELVSARRFLSVENFARSVGN
jgi:hypothetical protein